MNTAIIYPLNGVFLIRQNGRGDFFCWGACEEAVVAEGDERRPYESEIQLFSLLVLPAPKLQETKRPLKNPFCSGDEWTLVTGKHLIALGSDLCCSMQHVAYLSTRFLLLHLSRQDADASNSARCRSTFCP
ncbi:hypothetical protein D5086_020573 [Populus alba]|uniref:Uncharacterized protein n=1 Tax=Populus alba TaxID=43335 RepID=A0ACC4BLW3_POPAL